MSKVERGVTSILGDRDSKDSQSQQETEWCLSSLAIVTGSSTLPQSMTATLACSAFLSPPDVVHQCTGRLASLRRCSYKQAAPGR